MNSKDIELKIKRLRYFKVYDFSSISNDLDNDRNRISVKLKRESEKGRIVFIGKGKFYKRDKPFEGKRAEFNNPKDKSALRYGNIKPSKYPVFKAMFWSNSNVPISLDNYISRILSENAINYLVPLRILFGDRKVKEVYLNNFYPQNRKNEVEDFLCI